MSSSLCGRERVDREQAERRRAVDEDEVEALLEVAEVFIQRRTQAVLAGDLRHELDLRAGEVDRARRAQQIRRLRADLHDVRERELVDQHVVDARNVGGVRHSEGRRGVSLRIQVDHEDPSAHGGQGCRDVDGRRRLADAALLVRDGDHPRASAQSDADVSRAPGDERSDPRVHVREGLSSNEKAAGDSAFSGCFT